MARVRLLALLLVCAVYAASRARACEPLAVEACRGIGYNHTGLSALAQKEAEFMLQSFSPLVQYGCSAQLRLLLCAVFAPMCTDKVAAPIGPCRGLCQAVRRRCLPVLHGFGFPWPASLNCSLFPADNNHETMCMEGPGEQEPPPPAADAPAPPPTPPLPPRDACPQGAPSRCQPACDADVAWSAADKRLAEAWATGWAAVGFAASLGAALTLVGGGGGGRGRQGGVSGAGAGPSRSPPAVAFLALSHNLCAVGWAVRAAAGRRAVACGAGHALLLTRDGLSNANCAVVFLLLYYFGTAASVWWVVLCLSWFLAAGGGWSEERVRQQASLFHLAGWGLPAVCTVAVLVLRHVDADELTGSCYVGNHSARSLLVLVVVPQLAWLSAGCALLAAGWLGCRRRGAAAGMRTLGPDARLNQGELCRLGALSGACALPAALSLLALLVEYGARRGQEAGAGAAGAAPLWAPLLRLAAGHAGAVAVAAWAWLCSPPACRSLRAWRRLQPCKQPPPAAPALPPPPLYYRPAPPAPAQLQLAAQPLLPAALGHPHAHPQPLLLPAAHAAHTHAAHAYAHSYGHGGHKPVRKHRSKHAKHGSETTV